MPKTQAQIVVETLEKLGGVQTLGLITQESLKNPEFKFSGKSPQQILEELFSKQKKFIK